MEPLVSVIVPIYKVEKYLRQCVDSILAQTYTNLEVILVDDGSPDKCGAICDEYAAKDERVRVIHKENGGVSDARNAGLDAARGEYLAFVDGDDYISVSYIASLMSGHMFDIAFGGCIQFENEGAGTQTVGATNKEERYSNGVPFIVESRLIHNSLFGYSGAKIYRFEKIKTLVFDKMQREDIAFNLKSSKQWEKVFISPANGYYYRQHNDSLLHQKRSGPVPDIVSTSLKLLVDDTRFTKKERRYLSNFIIKTYIIDVLSISVMNNSALSYEQKYAEIYKVLSDNNIRKILKLYRDDNWAFRILVVCFKLRLPWIYYAYLKRNCNE